MKTGQGTLHFSVKLCVFLALCWIPWCTDWEARKEASVKLCAAFAFLRLPVWSLDSGNTALFLLVLLELQCRSPAEPGWDLCLCLNSHRNTQPVIPHKPQSLHTTSNLFCVHRTDLIREVAKLSPSCVQLNSQFVTKLAQIPPVQTLGCYSSSNAVNCLLPKESPDQCSSCMLETDV